MSVYSIELWTVALVATIFVIGGFSVFARWCLNSPAIRGKKLESLQVGITAAELKALLGEPRMKRPNEKGNDYWVYGARWKRHLLVVEVNPAGIVTEFMHGVPHMRKTKSTPDV